MFSRGSKKYQKILVYTIILSMQLNVFAYAASVVTPDKTNGRNLGTGTLRYGAATKDSQSKLGDKGYIPNIPMSSGDDAYSTTKLTVITMPLLRGRRAKFAIPS